VLDTYLTYNQNKTLKTDFNVGVMYCGSTTEGAKLMIDRVKGYTNLFLQSNSQIVYNQTQLEEVCEYAVDAGLNFIVNLGTASSINYENSTWGPLKWTWQFDWLDMAKERWGNKFVGVYYYDEPGGIHIDANWDQSSGDYYNTSLFYQWVISSEAGLTALREKNITIFTSDYALYWFDYLAGFDVVLGEQCPNASGVQTVDMVRGAADMQGKDWGITITWSDPTPPYLGSPQEMYQQMLTAY
jgi:hypothetical protein